MNKFSHVAAAIGFSLIGVAAVCGQDNPELASIDERVAKLEKAVIRDAFHPDEPALARLKKIEERLDADDRTGGISAKAQAKDDDQVHAALDSLDRDTKALDQRLKRMEDTARKTESPASANELRDIENSMAQLTRSLGDLQERIRKLEAKK